MQVFTKTSIRLLIGLLFIIKLTKQNKYVPLFGNATLGYYYVEAYIGTPPQKKSLIVDTGSHLTIFPCEGCTKCKKDHLYKIFETSKSSTFSYIDPTETYFSWTCSQPAPGKRCFFEQGYTEGSVYSGFYAIDNFLFENELNHLANVNHKHIFGCAMEETNEFYRQKADGIIGIGVLNKNMYRNPPTILDTEVIERRIDKETFSICFAHNGGVMSFGQSNFHRHLPNSEHIKLNCEGFNWDEQFEVDLTGLKVN